MRQKESDKEKDAFVAVWLFAAFSSWTVDLASDSPFARFANTNFDFSQGAQRSVRYTCFSQKATILVDDDKHSEYKSLFAFFVKRKKWQWFR